MEKLSISIEDVRFYANHGVFEQEQVVGNEFSVSVSIEMPVIKTIENDDLADTISYADIYDVVSFEMKQTSKLIENVAYRILNNIRKKWNEVDKISVKVENLSPPIMSFEGKASVVLTYEKD